jgi:Zn-dependent metalloprotease/uncharacterized protein YjdB
MMRHVKVALPLLLLLFAGILHAGQGNGRAKVAAETRNPKDNTVKSIVFAPESTLAAADATTVFRDYLGIDISKTTMTLKHETKTKRGIIVQRYEQFISGIKVEFSSCALMTKEGIVRSANANYYNVNATLTTAPLLTEAAALAKAIAQTGAQKYMWQNANAERALKQKTHNEAATYYPHGTLVYVEDFTKLDRQLHLAYAFDVYAEAPLSRDMVYVDAATGKILFVNKTLKHVIGNGPSLYSGNVRFQTVLDSASGFYYLNDLTRGGGVFTYTLAGGTSVGYQVASSSLTFDRDAAIDAHWGAQKVYDYWNTQQGRNSFDDAGSPMYSYVHFDTDYDNAFWTGYEMVYGDGSGSSSGGFDPLTSLDICGHELGHAICQYTAGLIYFSESGAINEGFSDIWGAVVENYANPRERDSRAKQIWAIGEEIGNQPLRRMDTPEIRYNPGTYGGSYWYPTTSCTADSWDNCGVHNNSGVMNHWFYLLSQGGSGTNDIGHSYSVTGVGINTAADIAYQTELMLSSTADYAECRTASINAAYILSGSLCSPEVIAVRDAWYAVGVFSGDGSGTAAGTISGPASLCVGASSTYTNSASGGFWYSTNTAVATVSSTGVVTARDTGRATIIYCVSTSCGVYNASIAVTVQSTPSVLITGSSTIAIGFPVYFGGGSPGGTWRSSTTAIATVDATGLVTGRAAGTCNISYTFTNACGTQVAQKSVRVSTSVPLGASPIITTVAGNGSRPAVDGVLATASGLLTPVGITEDRAGNLIVAEGWGHKIRRITPFGIISTIAGDGYQDSTDGTGRFTGDGGAATATSINQPVGIIVDPSGNILFADCLNNRIRRISTSGIITTIAGNGSLGYSGDGGPATAATLQRPVGIARDASGNIYIADGENNRVRRISTTGIISTIAGSASSGYSGDGGAATAATLSFPSSVAVDASNNIFIVDRGNSRIRRVTGGIITTVAGNGSTTASGDGGAATSAGISPFFISVDGSGNFYISDAVNNKVRVVNSAGIINTVAGTGTAGYSGDLGPATAAELNNSYGVYMSPAGNLYIGDSWNERVRKLCSLPSVAAIAGATTVCSGVSTTLTDSTSGGIWSSSDPSIASINVVSGVARGVSAGTVTISYVVTNTCGATLVTRNLTVTATPSVAALTGSTDICNGTTSTLSSATSGGTWSSSNNSVASVTTAGVVRGNSLGTATITYSVVNSCGTTRAFAFVNVLGVPTPSRILYSSTTMCAGGTMLLFDSTWGGSWSSSNVSVAALDSFGLYSIPHTGVIGVSAGTATITYSVPYTCGTGRVTQSITVTGPPAAPAAIAGATTVCRGATITRTTTTTGGFWSSSDPSIASISSAGVVSGVSTGSVTISYTVTNSCGSTSSTSGMTVIAAPSVAALTGSTDICNGTTSTLSSATSGGTWSSSNNTVASVTTAGVVRGNSVGTATITYSVVNSCGTTRAFAFVTISGVPAPSPIIGSSTLCVGATTTFIDSTWGGFWSSSNPSVAIVDSLGRVRGISVGSATITYSVAYTCGTGRATRAITVTGPPATPAAIAGATTVCTGATTTRTCVTAGGVWSSSNTSVASINSTGVVSALSTGSVTISYTVTNSCGSTSATSIMTVNTLLSVPPSVGLSSVCRGATIVLTNSTPGGVWSSSSAPVASVSSIGTVTGVSAGTANISYTVTNSCGSTVVTTPITVIGTPTAGTITVPGTLCLGATGALTSTIPGGIWSSIGGTALRVTDSSIGTYSADRIDSALIQYSVTNECGTATAYRAINIITSPVVGSITSTFGSVGLPWCLRLRDTLRCATFGGVWSSADVSLATVGSTTGLVDAISVGTVTFSYTVTNSCGSTVATTMRTIVGDPVVPPIMGASSVCVAGSTTLANSMSGGYWTNSSASATISSSGLLTGVSAGTTVVTYSVYSFCGYGQSISTITVNPLPATPATITGPSRHAVNTTITLANSVSGGTWSCPSTLIASVNSSGLVYGIGPGVALISYTISNSCGSSMVTKSDTVTSPVSGPSSLCVGGSGTLTDSVFGGTWYTTSPFIASIGSSSGVATGLSAGVAGIVYRFGSTGVHTFNITVFSPIIAAISGTRTLCLGGTTTLNCATSGGVWSSGNPSIASINSSGVVTGVSTGTADITYSVTNICGTNRSIATVTVTNGYVAGIVGVSYLCRGVSARLLDSTLGGTWVSSNPTVATVSSTGVVTALSTGSVSIGYIVTSPCGTNVRFKSIDVIAPPTAGTVSGGREFCIGSSITLTPTVSGGTWSTIPTGRASISAIGVVTGISTGGVTAVYTVANACGIAAATQPFTVSNTPSAGTPAVPSSLNVGDAVTLVSTVSGGTWVSTNTSLAVITGGNMLSGVAVGLDTVIYTVTNLCGTVSATRAVTITGLTTAGVISGTSVLCSGSTVTFTSSTAGGTWSSSSTSVASVVSTTGAVRAGSAGAAVITYTIGTQRSTYSVRVVSSSVGAISGASNVCPGTTSSYASTTAGGVWQNSNLSIGSISAVGDYRGLASGTDTISYSVTNSCGTTRVRRTITVTGRPTVAGTTLVSGNNCLMTTSVLRNTTAGGVWTLSDPTIGAITAVSSPSVTVTGWTAGADTLKYTVTNSCGLTNTANYTVNFLSLPDPGFISGPTTVAVGSTITLTSSVTGGTWISVFSGVASITTGGVVRGLAVNFDTIKYSRTNTCGTVASVYLIAVTASKQSPQQEELPISTNNIEVFPNPTTGTLRIVLGKVNEYADIVVYDMTGKALYQSRTTENETTADLSYYAAGTYLIQVRTGDEVYKVKVVRQ